MRYITLTEEEIFSINGGGFFEDLGILIGKGYGSRMKICEKIGYTSKGCN